MANTLAKSTAVRFMEDEQNSSAASTPVMTPQPDLRDKRLPSINHSYFGQVRPRSASSTPSASVHPLVAPAPARSVASSQPLHAKEHMVGSDGPLTAPSSPDVQPFEEGEPPALLPHERLGDSQQRLLPDHEDIDSYPTPPISSSSSMHKEQAPHSDLIERTSTSSDPVQASGSAAEDKSPATLSTPLRPRRHTFALLNPLSSIVTSSNVHAAHISNPSTDHSTASTPPADPASSASGTVPATLSYSELRKLTSGVSLAPLKKTTPPQTPRALSHEANSGDQQRSSQGSNNDVPGVQQTSGPDKDIENHGPGTESSPAPNAAAAVGPPKGKLIVRITEGRGLRPSHDPYVVCVFEWNEYISKGPKHEHVGAVDQNGHKKPEASGAVPIRRSTSDMGRPMAIPMKSRQSSNTSLTDSRDGRDAEEVTDPKWDLEAVFDVVGMHSEIDVSVYDRWNQEAFLGHVRFCPNLHDDTAALDSWFKLEPRTAESEQVTGEIHLQMRFQKTDKKHYGPEDFQILKLIGKGTFGQVYQVRKKDTQRIYAMKVLSKKVIVQKKEVAHTLGERNILVRTAMADSPFIVGLKFSFQTPTDLYLVTDYMSGGELFWHLQKEGRFNEQRAKFYIAELILALQHLHEHDIVYRDLKPENILLDANGHIALCDFGLSKANLTKNDTTNTFCGTTEYLAPEVLLDEQGYTKMVDFWSLGVLVFEMCCGWSPFYAEDTQQMYKNIAFGKVRFPRDALSTEGRNFVKGLLNRNPKHRLGANHDAEELKAHPFFADVDWDALTKKNVVPPFKPKLKSETDTSNFDPEFTNALNGASSLNARAAALAAGTAAASTPLSPGMQANFQGFTFVDESSIDDHFPRQSSDRMDEDEKIDDDWEMSSAARDHRGDRMSGVMKTGGGEEGVFNHGNFDI